jgi:hypothetical protein
LKTEGTHFTIIGLIEGAQTIAEGHGIRELDRLTRFYGTGTWRKRKGTAEIRLDSGWVGRAELHWYEAHGIGKREFKIKRLLD